MGDVMHVIPFRAPATALSFDASTLAVTSADATVRVRSLQYPRYIAHTRLLQIFDIVTYQQKRVLNGHQGSVVCLKLHEGQLVTGATDHTAKLWDLRNVK